MSFSMTAAGVAELADASGLGPGGVIPVEVRVLSPALLRYHRKLPCNLTTHGALNHTVPLVALTFTQNRPAFPEEK